MTDTEVRALFPAATRTIYLNAAAVAPLPSPVAEAMCAVIERQLRLGVFGYPDEQREIAVARAAAARLVGVAPGEVAFVAGAAEAIGKIADGLDWKDGDEILLPDIEYPSNCFPWAAQHRRGARLALVRSDCGRVEADEIIGRITKHTRVVAVSWVQFASGYRTDLKPLADVCRERGVLLVVDAAQGLGAVPLDVSKIQVGALVTVARKWLFGPSGAALLYVAPGWRDRIRPADVGARSIREGDDFLSYRRHMGTTGQLELGPLLREGTDRYESGFLDAVSIAGFGAALALGERIGRDAVARRVAERVSRVVERAEASGLEVYGPRSPGERAGIISLTVPGSAEAIWRRLHAEGITLSVRDGRLRLSPHVWNTLDEIDHAVERIRALAH